MELFPGGQNEKFQTKAMQIGLNPKDIEYLQNLQSEIGADLLKKKFKYTEIQGKCFSTMLKAEKVCISLY